jgi:Ca2+-binding EF-hand superfamily protein
MSFENEKQRLLDIFKAFDTNNDGMLDTKELVAGYNRFFNGDIERAEYEAE